MTAAGKDRREHEKQRTKPGTMKKLPIMLAAAALFTTMGLSAQEKKTDRDPAEMEQRGQERAQERSAYLTKELGLNDEQSRKVELINSDFARSMTDLKASGADQATSKTKAKALREQRETDLRSVLTEAQYAQLKELRKAKRAEHMEKRGQMKAAPQAQ
jgi:hypothetical protein